MSDPNDKYWIWREEMGNDPEIKKLADQIAEYEEEYFSDLTLNDFIELCDYDNQTDIKSLFDYPYWRFYIVPDDHPDLDSADGICRYDIENGEFYIKIGESHKNDKATILHEMIHAYEDLVKDSNYISSQLLLILLYDKLYRKIPDLKYYLYLIANRDLFHFEFNLTHTPTFLLKSFDLDLRLGLPLGSIVAYGKHEWIDALNNQIKSSGKTKIELVWGEPIDLEKK
jgi:hypothetical protein